MLSYNLSEHRCTNAATFHPSKLSIFPTSETFSRKTIYYLLFPGEEKPLKEFIFYLY